MEHTARYHTEPQAKKQRQSVQEKKKFSQLLSGGFTLPCPDALAAYHELREANPSPYMFYVAAPSFKLLSASPESALLHSARTGEVSIRPIAGPPPGPGP